MLQLAKVRQRLADELMSKFGDREAANMASYYVDAYRDKIEEGTLTEEELESDIAKMMEEHPVQYVTNTSYFYDHKLYVDEHVLIPRPETEELVHWVISDHKKNPRSLDILDIGSGSGCILLSICNAISFNKATGIDISSGAIGVLQRNAEQLGIAIEALCIDVLQDDLSSLDDAYDIIVSNPPYILMSEMGRVGTNVLGIEPEEALFVNSLDPLLFYNRILELSKHKLKPGGALYFETSDIYHDELEALTNQYTSNYEFRRDMQGKWRMLKVQF